MFGRRRRRRSAGTGDGDQPIKIGQAGEAPLRTGGDDCFNQVACEGCCDLTGAFDGCGWLTVFAAVTQLAALLAAIAGTGELGRRLRHEALAPRTSLAAAMHRGVRYYQLRLSARRPNYGCCHFTPTCSAYAAEALRKHGAFTGARLALRRLRRCKPGVAGGVDLVP